MGGIIIGNPMDTEKKIWTNYEFMKQLQVDFPLFMTLTPYPKTGVRDKLIKEGLITNIDNYSKYDCFSTNIRTKYLSSGELAKLRKKIEFKFPLESGAIWRLIRAFPSFFLKLIIRSIFK